MGEPSTVATGGAAGFSGTAGAAACWPFPQAAISTAVAVTMDRRVHGVLKNWVIGILYAKKKALWPKGRCARGRQFSLKRPVSHQFLMAGPASSGTCCTAPEHRMSVGRRQRLNRERMNVGLHQVVDCGVDQSMPRQGRNSPECLSDDSYTKVAMSVRSAGMPCVQMAFVFDNELRRRKPCLQPFTQALRAVSGSRGRDLTGQPENLRNQENDGRRSNAKHRSEAP